MVCPPSSSPGDCAFSSLQLALHPLAKNWWAVTDSNRRHSACKADALPTELTARRHDLSPGSHTAQGRPAMRNCHTTNESRGRLLRRRVTPIASMT